MGFLKKLKDTAEKGVEKGTDLGKKGVEKGTELGTKGYDGVKESAKKRTRQSKRRLTFLYFLVFCGLECALIICRTVLSESVNSILHILHTRLVS